MFRVEGLGFRVEARGFRVEGSRLRDVGRIVKVLGVMLLAKGLGSRTGFGGLYPKVPST